jgi:membrane-bound lytic murein transglycosylase D
LRGRAQLAGLVAVLFLGLGLSGSRAPAPRLEEFPEPEALRTAVAFWKRVYLEVTTQGGLLHDSRHLGVVYETIRFQGEKSQRKRQKRIDQRKRDWRARLRRLAKSNEPRGDQEETVLRLLELELGHPPTAADLRNAAHRIRFQLGQRDKFRKGIIRSGAYENAMRAIFHQAGLPEDLACLPHVESSFNVKAYSKYGAAGVWQFMRSTGKRYLQIDYIVDERLDPIASTRAAARLLEDNYESLGNWPLAITAYNHGVAGMRRAKRKLGTGDLAVIVKKYRSRSFGFASRNFYAQFLAARKVLRAYETYFGPLDRDEPEVVDEIALPFFADVKDLEKHLGVSPEVIRHYNAALRPPVFRAGKRIPKNHVLRLPAGTVSPSPEEWLAAIPKKLRHAKQHRSRYYRVRRGDALSKIAARNHTSVETLVALNNLPSRHRIYPGQVLQLPEGRGTGGKKSFSLVKSAHASPKRQSTPPNKIQRKSEPPKIQRKSGPPPPTPDGSARSRLEGDSVIVEALETLGHYADWLEIPTQRLRDLNHLYARRPLHMGQRLELDFSRVDRETFLQRRLEYHKGVEEDFFGSFRVTGILEHKLRRGESLWLLSHRVYRVPTWLIQRYNPELDLTALKPGTKLNIPVVEPTG